MEFNIPKSWDDISVDFWKSLIQMKPEDFINQYEYKLELLYTLLGSDGDDLDIDELDIDEVIEILDSIEWIFKEPSINFKKEINGLRVKNISRLKLGEFIDIESFVKNGYIENIEMVASILYKKYKEDEWGNEIEEPYIYDIYKRGDIFKKCNISDIYGILKHYIDWKNKFMDVFTTLFEDPDFDKIEDEDKLSPQELEEIRKEIESNKKKSAFNWHLLIWKLSDGDITKMDAITNLPVNYVFTTLAMKKSLEL